MNYTKMLIIGTLSSTILMGGAISVSANDETDQDKQTRSVNTEGQIIFTPSTDEELVVIPPETGPDVVIPPEVPGTTGPLSIMRAATMNFGSQVISNQDQTYNMVAERQQLAGTTGDANKVPYVSFAQVQDTRGNNAGWDLRVSLSDFTAPGTARNRILTGAQIELVNARLQYEGASTNEPTVHANGLQLLPNAGSVPVMTASEGRGAGTSSVVWGNQADLDRQAALPGNNVVTNDAIQLSVPGSTAKDATTYRSTLTWELSTTPDNEEEDTPDTPNTPSA